MAAAFSPSGLKVCSKIAPGKPCFGEHNGGCHTHATCTATPGSNGTAQKTCICGEGYAGDGMSCHPTVCSDGDNGGCFVGASVAGGVRANATCHGVSRDGSARCICPSGYRGNGTDCELDYGCQDSNYGGCNRTSELCVNDDNRGTSHCACRPGYTPSNGDNDSGNGTAVGCDPIAALCNATVTHAHCPTYSICVLNDTSGGVDGGGGGGWCECPVGYVEVDAAGAGAGTGTAGAGSTESTSWMPGKACRPVDPCAGGARCQGDNQVSQPTGI